MKRLHYFHVQPACVIILYVASTQDLIAIRYPVEIITTKVSKKINASVHTYCERLQAQGEDPSLPVMYYKPSRVQEDEQGVLTG